MAFGDGVSAYHMKKIFVGALLLTGCSWAAFGTVPLTIDVANNQVNVPGTIVSDQIHKDYYQLANKVDIFSYLSSVSNSMWSTSTLFITNDTTCAGYGLVALDNGIVISVDENNKLRRSVDYGASYNYTNTLPFSIAGGYGSYYSPSIAADCQGNLYGAAVTGSPTRLVVYKSTDFGSTWTLNFSSDFNGGSGLGSMAVSEAGHIVVFTGYTNSAGLSNVYAAVSGPGGTTWSYKEFSAIQTKEYRRPVDINIRYRSVVYAGNGIFVALHAYRDYTGFDIVRSTDYGQTWTLAAQYSPADGAVRTYSYASDGYGTIGAMVRNSSGNPPLKFYISHDYGATWKTIASYPIAMSAQPIYAKNWVVWNGAGNQVYFSSDDLVSSNTIYRLTQNGDLDRSSFVLSKDALYFHHSGLYSDTYTNASAIFSLRFNSAAILVPAAIPVITNTPVAFPGAIYSDGANMYRSTNGTTWTAF